MQLNLEKRNGRFINNYDSFVNGEKKVRDTEKKKEENTSKLNRWLKISVCNYLISSYKFCVL